MDHPPGHPGDAVRVATSSMRVRFEILLRGPDSSRLRAAGEEALALVHQIEDDLSPYRPGSDIHRLNAADPASPVRVQASTIRFLLACQAGHAETNGLFDPTIGPLMELWGLVGTPTHPRIPEADAIASVIERIGLDRQLRIDEEDSLVAWETAGCRFDPGGAGKGWAIDQAAELLIDLGIESALLHAGTSSVRAVGGPYPIRIAGGDSRVIALESQALSVSAVHGKGFEVDGIYYGHVIDPRTGLPVFNAIGAAALSNTALDAEIWSTAALIGSSQTIDRKSTGPGLSVWTW